MSSQDKNVSQPEGKTDIVKLNLPCLAASVCGCCLFVLKKLILNRDPLSQF